MAEKSGVFNGLTVGLQGTNKKGNAYTIYNANILFPSGKSFKLNVPSWSDMYQDIKDLPVGTGIKYEVDDRNNITEYTISARVATTSPPAPAQPNPTAQPVFQPAGPVEFKPSVPADTIRPVQSIFGYTERDLRVKAIELAVEFYKGAGTQKERMATEELVFNMAERIFTSLRPANVKIELIKPKDAPSIGDEFGQPPVTDDDIPF